MNKKSFLDLFTLSDNFYKDMKVVKEKPIKKDETKEDDNGAKSPYFIFSGLVISIIISIIYFLMFNNVGYYFTLSIISIVAILFVFCVPIILNKILKKRLM